MNDEGLSRKWSAGDPFPAKNHSAHGKHRHRDTPSRDRAEQAIPRGLAPHGRTDPRPDIGRR